MSTRIRGYGAPSRASSAIIAASSACSAWKQAVRKMTGLSAARFGLAGRGVLAAGAYADLCVFDPDSVIDRATFAEPTLPAAGIEHVFVNGRPVWSDGKPTGERPGRALRRQQCSDKPRRSSGGAVAPMSRG